VKHKERKIHGQVEAAQIILEAFGNCMTKRNKSASKFGLAQQLLFKTSGKLIGANTLDFMLDANRVTEVPEEERGFHIFYYFLAGASSSLKSSLGLSEGASNYHYLAQSKQFKIPNVSDAEKYAQLLEAFKAVGINKKISENMFSLLAAILLLGNVTFSESDAKVQEACKVDNQDSLDKIAMLLGVSSKNLETSLVYTTKTVNKDHFTAFLNLDEIYAQRDALAKVLYKLLFRAIVEFLNHRYSKEDAEVVLTLLDFPGQNLDDTNYFHEFLWNYASDCLFDTFWTRIATHEKLLTAQGFTSVDTSKAPSISSTLSLFHRPSIGLFPVLEDLFQRRISGGASNEVMIDTFNKHHGITSVYVVTKSPNAIFGIQHFGGAVVYSKEGFVQANENSVCPDFVMLFKGGPDISASSKNFVSGMFSSSHVVCEYHRDSPYLVTAALVRSRPLRKMITGAKNEELKVIQEDAFDSATSQYQSGMKNLLQAVANAQPWFAFCVNPFDVKDDKRWDSKSVKTQVSAFGINALRKKSRSLFTCTLDEHDFSSRYQRVLQSLNINLGTRPIDNARAVAIKQEWPLNSYFVGKSTLFLREATLGRLESILLEEKRKERKNKQSEGERVTPSVMDDMTSVADSEATDQTFDDNESFHNYDPNVNQSAEGGKEATEKALGEKELLHKKKEVEIVKLSPARKNWLYYVKFTTWWIPEKCLKWRMDREDIRLAWREKVALCISVLLLSAVMLFYIVGLARIVCPYKDVFNLNEISYRSSLEDDPLLTLYGRIFHIKDFATTHKVQSNLDRSQFLEFFGGKDVKTLFLMPRSVCGSNSEEKKALGLKPFTVTNVTDMYRLQQVFSHSQPTRNLDFLIKQYAAGTLVWDTSYMEAMVKQEESNFFVYQEEVFDVTDFIKEKEMTNENAEIMFPGGLGTQMRRNLSRVDWTEFMEKKMNKADRDKSLNCLRRLFAVGRVDQRKGPACMFAEYVLLAASILMSSVIVVKFLAALQLGSRRQPEQFDKFVIIQIPCYTEGEESIRRTLETCATMEYDDKRKLLFLIADGMIIGSGNDRPTPRIVLDVLGVDPSHDPEPLPYHALGEGGKQFNLAKIYSGVYEIEGHVVPYVVVVKCGKPSERSRPGNRGKRDSQLILMKFLSRVHYDDPMSPMELEICHQMKNVIGVDPSFYEYVLMVDADTEVLEDSLTRLVAACQHDSKIVGICGETVITNDNQSWVTMIQVYEYYISHHLSKAFESLFGTVTCLPGCFCMYRVKTQRNLPLIIARDVIKDYTENSVDTLHKKNLLHLGEDRYLTTLMLKHFPNSKLVFTSDSKCKTVVPDRWPVLLSQRRRWINSTVHNLFELLTLNELCGFCLFSMRFVVFIDLFATMTGPATVCYLVYLIVRLATEPITSSSTPFISLIIFAAVYGLQAVIFILHRRWEQIGWMILYILAIPVFSFYIPLYSFWHFDDFSWGNTRVVVGEGGKQQVIHGEGDAFNPEDIKWVRWSEFNKPVEDLYDAPPYDDAMSVTSGQSNTRRVGSIGSYVTAPTSLTVGGPQSVVAEPLDEEIQVEIQRILANADLSMITKKSVREQLNFHYEMDLTHRRDFINACIDQLLHNK
jgi:chitin synthase